MHQNSTSFNGSNWRRGVTPSENDSTLINFTIDKHQDPHFAAHGYHFLSCSIMFYHFLSFSISIHIYPHLSTFTRSHSPASPLTSLCHPAFWTTSKLALHFCNISNNPSSLVASIAFPALALAALADDHGWTIKDAQVNERSERSLEIFWVMIRYDKWLNWLCNYVNYGCLWMLVDIYGLWFMLS